MASESKSDSNYQIVFPLQPYIVPLGYHFEKGEHTTPGLKIPSRLPFYHMATDVLYNLFLTYPMLSPSSLLAAFHLHTGL